MAGLLSMAWTTSPSRRPAPAAGVFFEDEVYSERFEIPPSSDQIGAAHITLERSSETWLRLEDHLFSKVIDPSSDLLVPDRRGSRHRRGFGLAEQP